MTGEFIEGDQASFHSPSSTSSSTVVGFLLGIHKFYSCALIPSVRILFSVKCDVRDPTVLHVNKDLSKGSLTCLSSNVGIEDHIAILVCFQVFQISSEAVSHTSPFVFQPKSLIPSGPPALPT